MIYRNMIAARARGRLILGSSVLTSCVTLALLAGCGGPQPPSGAPGGMTQSPAIAGQAAHGKPLPGTGGEDLVYAAGGCGGVCILRYPDVKLTNSISLSGPVGGDCSDGEGNVFVTNNAQVLEYAHGGTTPIATLSVPGVDAAACSVDPRTGNLAVAVGGNSSGDIAIFADATGTPALYDAGQGALFCGYDGSGNLFVSGVLNQHNALAELPYQASMFMPITLSANTGGPGQVQWDGTYITLENRTDSDITIARLSISGSTASVVGKTKLRSPKWASQSWIAGNRVIAPYSSKGEYTNKIGSWRYPRSGKVVVKFGSFGDSTRIEGVTLSRD